MGILNDELNRIHREMAKIADKYFGEGEKIPNKRKYISTEYGVVNLRDGDTILHLDPEYLANMFWRVLDGKLTEVVRCMDCQYYYEQPRGFSPICELTRSRAEKEGFCSWGKKKDAEEE